MNDVYKIEQSGENMKLILFGRINSSVSDYLKENVLNKLDDVSNLYLDITQVEYISSAGLGFILMLQNEMDDKDGGEMTVSSCNDVILSIFKDTGFSNFLNWEE